MGSMSVSFGPGLHAAAGRRLDRAAYDRYLGRWSRLFVPAVLAAAEIAPGHRVLDVATGPGEAAAMALPVVQPAGIVIGADISAPMLEAATARFAGQRFAAVTSDGQGLPFRDGVFDAVLCQLGLMFFPDPARGLAEFRRVLKPHHRAAVCVISTAERAPIWGVLAEALSRQIPAQRDVLHLSFALSDPVGLAGLFRAAGFREIRVTHETHETAFPSFDDYWAPVEEATGVMPQAYRALPEPQRRAVQQEVRSRLAPFESTGRLIMSLEMLIATGRA
jgi:ubiquinone/menaquinone biosynthesis C-methylase UbiE